jgi:multiple antibiotic resistance protein
MTMLEMNELLLFSLGTFISLFSIVDPFMAAPMFVLLTRGQTDAVRRTTARKASTYVFWILTLFFISGSLILTFFGVSIDALRIAGGLMILSTAYGMLSRKDRLEPAETQEAAAKVEHHEDISFSPLAMPLLSGPGAIAVLIGMTSEAKNWSHYWAIWLVIALVSVSCYFVLRASDKIMARLGPTMVSAFTRIMGFILLGVGVQFVVNGLEPILTRIVLHAK